MFSGSMAKDESKIVDSLFGPAEPKSDEIGLITGLDGLGLGPSTEVSAIWGNDIHDDNNINELPDLGNLLSAPPPSTGFAENDHSRFAWGSST